MDLQSVHVLQLRGKPPTIIPPWGAWSGLLAAILLYRGWSPGGGDELVTPGDITEAAELRICVQIGWSSRGAEVELLHYGHQEEQELHPHQ